VEEAVQDGGNRHGAVRVDRVELGISIAFRIGEIVDRVPQARAGQ
jgi:hypothetical protein